MTEDGRALRGHWCVCCARARSLLDGPVELCQPPCEAVLRGGRRSAIRSKKRASSWNVQE